MSETTFNPWNKYFWGALTALGLLFTVQTCTPNQPVYALEANQIPQLRNEVLLPTVRIDNNCTGTILDNVNSDNDFDQFLTVLTAKHCMNSPVKIGEIHNVTYLITSENQIISELTVPLEVIRIAPGDMVILQGKTSVNVDFKTAEVITQEELSELVFGTKVYCVSFGAVRSPVLTEGSLGYIEQLEGHGDVQRASCPTIGGSSGSGLFVLLNGKFKLIGTLTGGWGESFNFYAPPYQLVQFMTAPQRR